MGKKFKISSSEISIGRSSDNSIVINDDLVSLKHIKIVCREGVYHLLDQISENGTYLNGKKLLRPKALHDWDEIKNREYNSHIQGLSKPDMINITA